MKRINKTLLTVLILAGMGLQAKTHTRSSQNRSRKQRSQKQSNNRSSNRSSKNNWYESQIREDRRSSAAKGAAIGGALLGTAAIASAASQSQPNNPVNHSVNPAMEEEMIVGESITTPLTKKEGSSIQPQKKVAKAKTATDLAMKRPFKLKNSADKTLRGRVMFKNEDGIKVTQLFRLKKGERIKLPTVPNKLVIQYTKLKGSRRGYIFKPKELNQGNIKNISVQAKIKDNQVNLDPLGTGRQRLETVINNAHKMFEDKKEKMMQGYKTRMEGRRNRLSQKRVAPVTAPAIEQLRIVEGVVTPVRENPLPAGRLIN